MVVLDQPTQRSLAVGENAPRGGWSLMENMTRTDIVNGAPLHGAAADLTTATPLPRTRPGGGAVSGADAGTFAPSPAPKASPWARSLV